MASSRAISPASGSEHASAMELTPRSKVKAMLAALDGDDSDEESNAAINRPSFTRINSIPTKPAPATTSSSANEESEDDDEIVRPRGRIAARMLMARDEERSSIRDDTQKSRIGGQLTTKAAAAVSSPVSKQDVARQESESDDAQSIRSRKRKVRVIRDVTPASSPAKSSFGSPSLFVSPAASIPQNDTSDHSDPDLPANPASNARFLELVAKKRREREAIQAEEIRKAEERARATAKHSKILESDTIEELDISDDEEGRHLTQKMRPSRKASKKALEDMARETQRMQRNMQLAHEARTKKKITKASLFSRFNYKPEGMEVPDLEEPRRPGSSSSIAHNSDALSKDTPPTSPSIRPETPSKFVGLTNQENVKDANVQTMNLDEDLPTLEEALSQDLPSSPPTFPTMDKGKGRAVEEFNVVMRAVTASKAPVFKQRPIKVHPPKMQTEAAAGSDSEDDLIIESAFKQSIQARTAAVFDRIPTKRTEQSSSLHTLKMLAHLRSPSKQAHRQKNARTSMTATELSQSLQQRARQQAAREREEHLQSLRDRGIVVQTAEEREKQMAEVEDLMTRARKEGEDIKRQEKEAAARSKKANGEAEPLGDSSDDEEWDGEGGLDAELSGSASEGEDGDVEFSGSEDEAMDEDVASMSDRDAQASKSLMNDEASEDDSEDEEPEPAEYELADPFVDNGDEDAPINQTRRRNKAAVISDDDDSEVGEVDTQTPAIQRRTSSRSLATDSPVAPTSVLRSATKTFIPGVTVAGPAGLGLTQIFAGTMDDSQSPYMQDSPIATRPDSCQLDPNQDSMSFLRNFPAPPLPAFVPTMDGDSQDMISDSQVLSQIPASQPLEVVSQGIQLDFEQSQVHEFDSMPQITDVDDYPELTQDMGFQEMTPIRGRFAEPPPSTVETVLIDRPATIEPEPVNATPIVKKKGRLQRRAAIASFSDEEVPEESIEEEVENAANVFNIMKKASKPKAVAENFDKKKSHAKEMVHEQAEESEDEYAGLGGNSDDESGGEEDAYVKEMIDDQSGDADERQIAAFAAERDRQNDEKAVERLYKDITTGALRRKRGADYSLDSDSDDDGSARRRMKQREFAKMRKALLADERIEKIAENPKSLAFLRAIEDRGDDSEMDFLGEFEESQADDYSQSQGESQSRDVVPNSQPDTSMPPPPKRKADDDGHAARLPPNLRRTAAGKKPSSLSEIRHSLSSLIEEPNAILAAQDGDSSEDELDIEAAADPEDLGNGDEGRKTSSQKENRDPFASRRTVAVVDRISLKRQSSSSVSSSTRMAFTSNTAAATGFKVPALLRRATTNSSTSSLTSTSVSGATERGFGKANGKSGNEEVVAKKAGRNSGIHFAAREMDRRGRVKEVERRREEKKFRGVEGRRERVGGLFGKGSWE